MVWFRSRVTLGGTASRNTGRSARSASMARRPCSTSRSSSPSRWNPSEASVNVVWRRMSWILSLRSSSASLASSSASSSGSCFSSATNRLLPPYLLRVDLLQRRALLEPRDLALGRIRDWEHPFDQPLEGGPCGAHLEGLEVDELAGEAVADRAPEVLLDPAVRAVRQRLALVVGAREARGEGVAEGRERTGLLQVGLGVADPDLDGRKGEVGTHAPPHLRVLVDRSRLVEPAHVLLEPGPALVDVRDAAAREHPGEDLGARRMQPAVDVLDERRRARECEQVWQPLPEAVAGRHRPIGAVDGDVHVQAEGVVAPDDVTQQLVVAPVRRRVDDALLLPGAPRVSARGAELGAERIGQRHELPTTLPHAGRGLGERLAAAGSDLDLRRDQLTDQVLLELGALCGRPELLEAVDERQRRRIEDRDLLLDCDGQIVGRLVLLTREPDLLLPGELLRFTH